MKHGIAKRKGNPSYAAAFPRGKAAAGAFPIDLLQQARDNDKTDLFSHLTRPGFLTYPIG